MSKTQEAFRLFDAYNMQDPRTVNVNGKSYPTEYFYALQLYNWVRKLEPAASEVLLLASRAQHIGRWKSPRESYPAGKAGYLSWRADLKKFHAETAAQLLTKAGYDENTIASVQRIILKQNIKTDHEVQVMEDALCLVFLEFQYEDFRKEHDEEQVTRIIRKTWKKMSDNGRAAALSLNQDLRI